MALMSNAEVMSQLVTIQNGLAAIQQNPAQENVAADARNEELEKIAETFAEVKEFLEADEFTLGELPPNNVVTPTRARRVHFGSAAR